MNASVDRSQAPAPGELAPFQFPSFERTTLANGIEVIAAHTAAAPLIGIAVLVDAGGKTGPVDRPGLVALHAALLDEGTSQRDALALARRIEQLGGSLDSGADWEVAAVQGGMLAEHLDEGLALCAEVLFDAQFPEAEVERIRQQRLGDLLRRRDHPSTLAEQFFADTVYRDTVYGHPLIGTEECIAALTRDELRDFYQQRVRSAGTTVVVVGDVATTRLIDAAAAAFGSARRGAAPAPPAPITPHPDQRRVLVVDRPEAAQTQLQLGHVSVPRSAPGFPERVLLNTILGGSFTSRLNLNLREHHGITYGVRSSFVRRNGPAPFVVRAAVDTDKTGLATRETLGEIERLREGGVTADELRHAQQFLVGVFPYTVETVGDLAQRLEDLVVFDLPDDHFDGHAARISAVTAEGVHEAAREHLRPEEATIVAVGPAKALEPQLAPFGAVEVVTP